MNLGDPELELIDPTPNVHALFLQFDKVFFFTKLASRAVVRWSKRMYSCAGICSYEGRGGLCDIALSEPLLKLRSRKDIVETLLHEMIHAFLFVTNRDQDRDGHGPNFKEHMYRINCCAGLNISIYHSFHDEVNVYQTHWWRCDGPCHKQRPYFGTVRRPMNRAPGPTDRWWNYHKINCGGNFIKIKEPEKKEKKKAAKSNPRADITKYISIGKSNTPNNTQKPVLKDSNSIPVKTVSTTKKAPNLNHTKPPVLFGGKGQTIDNGKPISDNEVVNTLRKVCKLPNPSDVVDTVRNVWANKQLSSTLNNTNLSTHKGKETIRNSKIEVCNNINSRKQKTAAEHVNSPPTKIKKIDDYFLKTTTSILKDVYGEDFVLTEQGKGKKLVAVVAKVNSLSKDKNNIAVSNSDIVDCPVCRSQFSSLEINKHLDECLNREVIENLNSDSVQTKKSISDQNLDPYFVKPYVKIENGVSDSRTAAPTIPIRNGNNEANFSNIKYPETWRSLKNSNTIDLTEIETNHSGNYIKSKDSIIPKEEKGLPSTLDYLTCGTTTEIKTEPGPSRDVDTTEQKCACCGETINKPVDEHLDECLAFFKTISGEASISFSYETIVIDDDDDVFDETQTFNETGTKLPCPCCLEMIEEADMNDHLDLCLC